MPSLSLKPRWYCCSRSNCITLQCAWIRETQGGGQTTRRCFDGWRAQVSDELLRALMAKLSGSSSWQLRHRAQLGSALRSYIIDCHTDWRGERRWRGGRKSFWMQWKTEISLLPEARCWVKYSVRESDIKALVALALLLFTPLSLFSIHFLSLYLSSSPHS